MFVRLNAHHVRYHLTYQTGERVHNVQLIHKATLFVEE